jgi:predicted nucleic acid-binding protein
VRPLVFDASALVALFRGNERVSALWFDAEAANVAVLLPAAAIAIANQQLRASDDAWTALLLTGNVHAMDLTPAVALGASRFRGDLAVAHSSYEASATDATIVTATAQAYDPLLRTVTF